MAGLPAGGQPCPPLRFGRRAHLSFNLILLHAVPLITETVYNRMILFISLADTFLRDNNYLK
jgi:hypothetical protein